jgi:putative tricarboxylic transport membrane protein
MDKKFADLRSGILIVLVCGLIYFWLIPAQIRYRGQAEIGPDFFPRLLVVCGGICGAIIALQAALKLKKAGKLNLRSLFKDPEAKVDFKKYLRHGIFLGSAILYMVSMQYIGFPAASVIYLAVLLLFFGHSKPLASLGLSAVYVAVVYLVFTYAFKISFPKGFLGF